MENQQKYAEMNVSAEISANFQGFFKRVRRKKVRADCILLQFFRKILSDLRGSRRLRLSKNQNLEHSGVVQISRKPHAPSTSTLTQGYLLVHDVDSKHENTTQCCSINVDSPALAWRDGRVGIKHLTTRVVPAMERHMGDTNTAR